MERFIKKKKGNFGQAVFKRFAIPALEDNNCYKYVSITHTAN
jgi:hypothetical protein